MSNRKLTIKFLILLLCSSLLAGCDNTAEQEDKATAHNEQMQAKLTELTSILEETQSEKENLETELAKIFQQLEETKSGAVTVLQLYEESKTLMDNLANERDTAVAEAMDAKKMVDELTGQLKDRAQQIREYEELVEELLTTIKDLETTIEEMSKQSTEKTDEEVAKNCKCLIYKKIREFTIPSLCSSTGLGPLSSPGPALNLPMNLCLLRPDKKDGIIKRMALSFIVIP